MIKLKLRMRTYRYGISKKCETTVRLHTSIVTRVCTCHPLPYPLPQTPINANSFFVESTSHSSTPLYLSITFMYTQSIMSLNCIGMYTIRDSESKEPHTQSNIVWVVCSAGLRVKNHVRMYFVCFRIYALTIPTKT